MRIRNFEPLELLPIVIGNMSIAVSLFVIGQVFKNSIINLASEAIFIAVTVAYIVSLITILFSYLMKKNSLSKDLKNPPRLSLMAFGGITFYAAGFFYITYFGLNHLSAEFISFVFIVVWLFIFFINLKNALLIYNGEFKITELNYLLIIPSIVLGAGIVITSVLIPYDFLFGEVQIGFTVYILSIMGFGISVIQFFLLSSFSLYSGVLNQTGIKKAGTTMIPLGAASIIILNLLLFPSFNNLRILYFPNKLSIDLSVMFWGFEVFVMITALWLAIKTIKSNHDITVWAFVFPVGISIFSDYLLLIATNFIMFKVSIIIVSFVLYIMYVYSVFHTINYVKKSNT
ncbi:hypothetical protein ACNF42_07700 [Cuniculiplasma sp. SKW3]|uniref:SLAC1 family transporter n=1 Tax=Cuniculiplasma sp. SKW3 TaxID=3400170 RepID=UPI003FD2C67F